MYPDSFPRSGAFNQFPWDFVLFWNCDIQTVFHTAELSTNSLRDFVACWKYDFYTVSLHSGAFNQFPG